MKVVLLFTGFAALSILITSACVANGLEPWHALVANMLAGALLGLITGLKK